MPMSKLFAPQAVTISCSQVLNTLVHVIAPVLPHLAEEIYSVLHGQPSFEISHESSVFSKPWVPLVLLCLSVVIRVSFVSSQSSDWHDPTAEQEMVQLLRVRSTVLGLLEQARGRRCVVPLLSYAAGLNVNTRQLSSSTEAEVDIILPSFRNDLTSLIMREGMSLYACWSTSTDGLYLVESFLKTLFIVSDVSVVEEGSLGTAPLPWLYEDSVSLPGETDLPP